MSISKTKKLIKGAFAATVIGAASLMTAGAALAEYPEKPITFIVPWGAGGGTDTTARIVGKLMEEALGVPVNVVNRTGGQGVVGHSAIATAEPDGYTLGLITAEVTMMHWQGLTDLTYESYTPLGKMVGVVGGLQVKAGSEYADAQAVIDAIKANPGGMTGSGTGLGGIWHLNMAGMLTSAGLDADAVRWVPSEGAAPALQELVAGGVDIVTPSINESAAMIEAGEVVSLAVMAPERSVHFPDVPTLKEATGIDWNAGSWNGVAGPAGLPDDVLAVLLPLIEEIQASEELAEFVNDRKLNLFALPADTWSGELADIDAAMGDTMRAAGIIE
ncbi:tripartite tricarboxylate transporter substrate binding protein [uncultured Shimia sp.]|uniref:tripartite tricarboxylate transporter substrate binding protein n=1 Tax=uncultured Shimia sp. TaxID=573152 RepID=UPI0025F48591|nr:tripartite tricarboxylate transporter substrate binding protein [uncultured Shimia sp.]